MPAQFGSEISKIGVASHEDHDIGPHLDGKLQRVDRHHNVHVRLVITFFGRRTILGHNHESVGAQPVDELVFPVPFVLPRQDGRRQSRIDHHLDQIASAVWPRQKIAELQPIEPASRSPHRAAYV